MPRIHVKALLLGALTDVGGSLVVGGFMGLAIGIVIGLGGGLTAIDQLEELSSSWWMLVSGFLVGLAFSLLGGFVAGRLARELEVLHGGLSGLLSALVGLLFPSSTLPTWFLVLCFVAAPLAGMLGGRLARRRDLGALPSPSGAAIAGRPES